MNYTNEQINIIIDRYKNVVNDISSKFDYDDNIKHLLYIIIPIFVLKYGLENEKDILKVFNDIPIIVYDVQDKNNPALFTRHIMKNDDSYKTDKSIIIKEFKNVDLINLLDSLIHEFNHAVNSIKNEINIQNDYIYLRTGISYIKYDMNLNFISKENSTLEEIINTKDTEDMINIIKKLSKYNINDYEISNLISNVNKEISSSYKSDSYLLQSYAAKSLIENTTFINTLRTLRYNGNTENIDDWFDNIVGKKNSFKNLNTLLNNSLEKEIEINKTKFFKNRKINQIKSNIINILKIVDIFNKNCNLK